MKKFIQSLITFVLICTFNVVSSQTEHQTESIKIINKNVYSKTGDAVPPATLNRVNFKTTECISEAARNAVKRNIAANKAALLEINPTLFGGHRTDHPLFVWPIQAAEGFDDYGYYTINFLVDHNSQPNNNLTDYNCAARTYDWGNGNHEGTDFILWPYPWLRMQEEVMEVVAAAPGVIIDKRDGNYDLNCVNDGSPNWNGIVLEHEDGSQSWYWHFKDGAITAKSIGESVEAGEYLGAAGSSGSSNWPHLHFEVYDSAGNLIDPFAGSCNQMNDDTWWVEQPDYFEPAINHISTHYTIQHDENCPNPELTYEQENFEIGDSLVLRIYYKDIQNAAITDLNIYSPNGEIWYSWSFASPWSDFATANAYWYFIIDEQWPEGEYNVSADFNGNTYETNFNIGEESGIGETPGFDFSIYPNPANNMLKIRGDDPVFDSNPELIIFNLVGKVVHKSISTKSETILSTAALPAGIYFLQVKAEDKISIKKFIINH